jgi:hypothetical protein
MEIEVGLSLLMCTGPKFPLDEVSSETRLLPALEI